MQPLSSVFLYCSLLSVDATENGLSTLPPPYAWKSRGIKDIRMNGNRISRLDLSDSGRFWPQLECLYLGQNKLKEVWHVCLCMFVCVFDTVCIANI